MPKTNLHSFAETKPLKVEERVKIVTAGSIFGWAGPSNRDVPVVVSHRHRYRYDGGKQDYMRKHEGYAYGERTLNLLEEKGIKRIAVFEVDNSRIVEYNISQFKDSDLKVNYWEEMGGLNFSVPLDEALHIWDREKCEIIDKH